MKRSNWLMTVAGIMSSMMGVPVLVMGMVTVGMYVPPWWPSASFCFIVVGGIGSLLMGFAGKGQDEHSTATQVRVSTVEAEVKAEVNAEPPQGKSWSGKSK
jgi:hypothetical protein